MTSWKYGLIVALGLGTGTAAVAATFDLTGKPESTSRAFTDTVDGIGLTVTPARFFDPTNSIIGPGGNDVVTRNANGMGIDRGFLDPPELNGATELLLLTFDQEVFFDSLTFGEVDGDDDFDLAIDGTFVLEDVNILASNPFLFSLALPGARGTTLGIGADTFGGIFGGGDDFRVAEISVSAVPLPAGILLLLTGVGGLALVGRRRKGAAA